MKIRQTNQAVGCSWISKGETRTYKSDEIYPDGICPFLYYSAYPYMLGLLFGADFMHSEEGDANVCCPAPGGCRAFVRRRAHPGVVDDKRIDPKSSFVIFAEVVAVEDCPAGHTKGQKFLFPTCMKEQHMCPASWYQGFPFMMAEIERPPCLDPGAVHCPDWDRPDMRVEIISKERE
jgi:uncharacterized repeat protein (TIGR04076 family)